MIINAKIKKINHKNNFDFPHSSMIPLSRGNKTKSKRKQQQAKTKTVDKSKARNVVEERERDRELTKRSLGLQLKRRGDHLNNARCDKTQEV
mmetsp:Transcript_39065/g.44525  ORF Transcript_39065/g.44525 Transcript_39065/m.44525 type:complete len:92 (+) Transcript_39065:303-578(+)